MTAASPFDRLHNRWQARRRQMGDSAVGRRGEDCVAQGRRIAEELTMLLGNRHFQHGLDFGCGWGRMIPAILPRCGHLWAADIFQDWVKKASSNPLVTGVVLESPKLPLDDKSCNLIVDIMTLQTFDLPLKQLYAPELGRVLADDGVVISLVKEDDDWVLSELPKFAGLNGWNQWTLDVVDEAGDIYYLLEGTRQVK